MLPLEKKNEKNPEFPFQTKLFPASSNEIEPIKNRSCSLIPSLRLALAEDFRAVTLLDQSLGGGHIAYVDTDFPYLWKSSSNAVDCDQSQFGWSFGASIAESL